VSIKPTPEMIERFKLNHDPANELEQPDVYSGLAAVLNMPEVRQAVVRTLSDNEIEAVLRLRAAEA